MLDCKALVAGKRGVGSEGGRLWLEVQARSKIRSEGGWFPGFSAFELNGARINFFCNNLRKEYSLL